ncbi:MAG: LysR family transcriptional regulator [Alphaproteobacteria bacterium]|nr:MAG: LysR family transcriptional regulator [Alphaproteobacteria bacterium]
MDLLALMRCFVRVAEAASFTAVAEETGSSQPTISRQIAQLEAHLGARLLLRSTRQVALTDEGQRFLDRARTVLDSVAEAEGSVGRKRMRPTGTLRLAMPVVFGRLHVAPRLSRLLARYPDLALDLVMHDGTTDLIEEGIDLAVRIGAVTDPSLIAKRFGTTRRLTVATPGYLAAHGTPRYPQDLGQHQCILYTRLSTGPVWRFSSPTGPLDVTVSGRVRANNSDGVRAAVLDGHGIAVVPNWMLTDELETGALVSLLTAFEPERLPMQVVYPSRRYVPLKTSAAIQFFETEFRLDPRFSTTMV